MSDNNKCTHEWGTDLNGNNTECTLCGIKLHQFDGLSTTGTLNNKCTHDWDIDYSTMLLSCPPKYNATCKKCGLITTKTQEECLVSNSKDVPSPTTITGENGNGPVNTKQWIPPVDEVCLGKYLNGSFEKIKPLFIGKDMFMAQDLEKGFEFAGTIGRWTFEPIPIKKIVNMELFFGTNFLLYSPAGIYPAKQLSAVSLSIYSPVLNFPNAAKGLTEEPEYLKPFKYEVTYFSKKCTWYATSQSLDLKMTGSMGNEYRS